MWGIGAAGLGISFLKAPGGERRPGAGLVPCGPLSGLPVGSARFVRHGTEPFFVLRASEDQVVAFSAICTHLRCVLTWNDAGKTLDCPCHDGSFDRNGNVLSGPPSRALRQHRAEIRAGEIVVRVDS